MFDVYIRFWKEANGTINSGSEKKMFSIPDATISGFPIHSPSVKQSEDAADSFDFTMEPGSEYYDSLAQLITLLRVEYSGTTIFYGRVLTVSGSTIYQTRNVHCEGSFAFFNDSYYEGIPEKNLDTISWSTYLDKILNNHYNRMVSGVARNDYKVVSRGTIGFTPTTEDRKFEPTGWSQTSALLNSLKDEYGGHMLTRYQSGTVYLDWYKYYNRDLGNGNRPVVSIGKNILDLTTNNEIDNIFTRVIPVGKTSNDGDRLYIEGYQYWDYTDSQAKTYTSQAMMVSMLPRIFPAGELDDEFHSSSDYANAENNYGIIYKTIEFSDADTQEKLWLECKTWIKKSYYGLVTSFEVRAVDMHMTGDSAQKILLGDCVDVYYKVMENGQMVEKYKKLVCKAIKFDLFNPENNTYTFGVPSDLLKVSRSRYQTEQQKQEEAKSSKGKKTASYAASTPSMTYESPDMELTFEKIAGIIRNDPDVANGYGGSKTSKDPTVSAADSFIQNGRMAGSFQVYDADIHYDPYGHPEICFSATLVGKITLPGKTTKYIGFNSAHGLFAFIGDQQGTVVGGLAAISKDLKYGDAYPTTHWYIKSAGYSYEETDPVIYDTINQAATYFVNTIMLPENRNAAITSTIAVANGILGIGKLLPGATSQNVLEGSLMLLDSANKIMDLVDPDKKVKTFIADIGTNVWNWLSGKSDTLEWPTISFSANDSKMTLNNPLKNQVTQRIENVQAAVMDGLNADFGFFQPVFDSIVGKYKAVATVDINGNDGGKMTLSKALTNTVSQAVETVQTALLDGKNSNLGFFMPVFDTLLNKYNPVPTVDIDGNDDGKVALNKAVVNSVTHGVQAIQTALFDGKNSKIGISQSSWNSSTQKYQAVPTIDLTGSNGGFMQLLTGVIENNRKTITASGRESEFKMYMGQSANENPTASVFGKEGAMAYVKSLIGKDGTKNQVTALLDGATAKLEIQDPTDASTEANMDPTVFIGGADGGTAAFSPEGTGASKSWKITINKPIQYRDSSGNLHTLYDSIKAEDFSMLTHVNSFRTEFAYIDTVVVPDLYAVKAYVDKLRANTIVADSYVRAANSYCTTLYAKDIKYTGVLDYTYSTSSGSQRTGHINKCFDSLRFSESNGTITLYMSKVDGSGEVSASFNMAATQFYKDAVAAATSAGRSSVYATNHTGLNPGASESISLYYNNDSGVQVWLKDSGTVSARSLNLQSKTATSDGTYTPDSGYDGLSSVTVDVEPSLSSITITDNGTYYPQTSDGFDEVVVAVPSGLDNYDKDDIDIPNDSWAWCDSSTPAPYADATLTKGPGLIKKNMRGYLYFDVTFAFSDSGIVKTYRMSIDTT